MFILYDVIIIGAGPAGLTAALYSSRAKLKTLIFGGPNPGGQIGLTFNVDNYPGFHEKISGPDLVKRLIKHAKKFGSKLVKKQVTKVDFSTQPYKVYSDNDIYMAQTIIIATGSINRKLGIEAEERLMGRGVFVCATCDAVLYEGLKVVVIGGGDSAIQEALDLSNFAEEVYVVHRDNTLRACKCLTELAEENEKIIFFYNTEMKDILGEKYVEAVKLRNNITGNETIMPTDGVLIAIGWIPNTSLFIGQLEIEGNGYIRTEGVKTSKPGIFVAGDINDTNYRQLITACSSGCMAALEAERYIQKLTK